ncbi:HMG domain-containing protein 3 isoform X2 [Boleophthalmus pectinirostris]|uniref:HMG domain-containing protein 3 isoform X2 n=1 Tax=Boleophthalmus pectinirostris TaxID=150288 RepID=UPI00242C5774|nr:HMG domain-containing protein 3 isoform X2 [Boleophthalmus pectinirostris]
MDKEDMYEVMKVTEEVETFNSQTDKSPPKKKRSKPHHQTCSLEKPKKPRSAYLLYYFDVHQVMQQEVPNLPQSEINKRISESWRRLSVAEKSYYLEKAKSEKEGTYSPSPSPSKELPGFRKILPRANYFVLAKGCSPGPQPGDAVPDLSRDCSDVGAVQPSVTVKEECPALGPSGEVEQYPQAVSVEAVPEEPADSKTHGMLPYTSFTILPNTESSPSTVSGTRVHEETPQVVALIPTQNLLAQSSLGSVTAVGPVMMMSSIEQTPKPSYNMPVKTYTRRGRGRCSNPTCSFVYVTRHKPPKCPQCGQYLGGKWIFHGEKFGKSTTNKVSNNAQIGNQGKKPKVKNFVMKQPTADKEEVAKIRVQTSPSSTTLGDTSSKTMAQPTRIIHTRTKKQKVIVQKKPVRPILPAYYNKITSPSNKEQNASSNSTFSVTQQALTGLKPSTLKQLGQALPTNMDKQIAPVSVEGPSTVASLDRKMNLVSVVPLKQRTVTSFNLGLPTSRGRGWCKNPACDYMYKNRHKPAVCPKCGLSLNQKKGIKSETLLDPYKALSAGQKDIQRQSTLLLLQRSLQFAESEVDLQDTLSLIQELNNLQIILVQESDAEPEENVETETLFESGWPHFFESASTHCSLCNYPLFKGGQNTVAGQVECWLLTETLMHRVSLQLKICLNVQCLALHSFTDIHPGLFNVGNRLLISMDLFLKIRACIKNGQPPAQVFETLLNHVSNHPIHTLTPEESGQVQELLQSGYWAFECLTVRDYNDMICGICGMAPKIEIAQRQNNLLSLKNVEFIWPESSNSDEVLVDDFWLTMESEALEQAAFPSDAPIIRVDASIIAPFFPPLMRSSTVINTEKHKVYAPKENTPGEPSVLVRLIHDGHLRLDKLEEHSNEELRAVLQKCGAHITQEMTKDDLVASLFSLYTQVHNGLSTAPEPSPHFTAGKLSKVCPHKVVSGSKCLIRRESARDHIDLLLSSLYWPPVYVSDCAQQVALCADTQYPELATQMWGRNQGCFCDPFEKPELVSCTELQDEVHCPDLEENQHVHPITRSVSRWLVHPPEGPQTEDPPTLKHYSVHLCKDLQPYIGLLNELDQDKQTEDTDNFDNTETSSQQQPVVFNNTAYYYLYNRLVDFLNSRDIVNQQVSQVLQACQPGEVLIRDALYRLGVAKIDTEKEEVIDQGQELEAVKVEPIVQT